MAADFMREVWAAAGGFPDALPTAPGAERSVLALVRQIRAVAATVENPQPLSTGIWPREACREGLRAALAQAQRPAEPAPESGAVDKQEDA